MQLFSDFSLPQQQLLLQGCAEFNSGQYFACHESLEQLWLQLEGQIKRLLQGLIQVAVACYHASHSNFKGASSLLQAGLQKIREHPVAWLQTETLVKQIQSYLLALNAAASTPPSPSFQSWRFVVKTAAQAESDKQTHLEPGHENPP